MEWTGTLARRKFVSRALAALGIAGAGSASAFAYSSPSTQSASGSASRWQPRMHPEDAWYDEIPGGHRFVFDTISPDGFSSAIGFAGTFFDASKSGYNIQDDDSAVIVIVRSRSTRFGYNDAMWAKYGKQFSEQMNNFVDPKTKEVPTVNVYATGGGALDKLIKRGVHVAVCQQATHGAASSLARATGGDADALFKELSENLVTNGRLVPAGIVAVNRAQEHGYAVYAGG